MLNASPISATWNELGNVVLTIEIILPQKSITSPEAYKLCAQIETLCTERKEKEVER